MHIMGFKRHVLSENFPITGIPPHVELIRALAAVKKAAARANMEVGVLKAKIGEPIVQAADEVLGGALHDQFIVDSIQGGAGTSMNMNANEVIANRAIELMGGKRVSICFARQTRTSTWRNRPTTCSRPRFASLP